MRLIRWIHHRRWLAASIVLVLLDWCCGVQHRAAQIEHWLRLPLQTLARLPFWLLFGELYIQACHELHLHIFNRHTSAVERAGDWRLYGTDSVVKSPDESTAAHFGHLGWLQVHRTLRVLLAFHSSEMPEDAQMIAEARRHVMREQLVRLLCVVCAPISLYWTDIRLLVMMLCACDFRHLFYQLTAVHEPRVPPAAVVAVPVSELEPSDTLGCVAHRGRLLCSPTSDAVHDMRPLLEHLRSAAFDAHLVLYLVDASTATTPASALPGLALQAHSRESTDRADECGICRGAAREYALVPCGHLGLCYQCVCRLRSRACPWCARPVTAVQRTYGV